LLAIAEKLAADEGIGYVFCDTDNMCFARPDNLPWAEFEERVNRIVDWFAAINPYRDKSKQGGSIFQIEHGADEQLRCLAVSAKRYALYRLGDPAKGEPRVVIAKISAHGLGAFWDPSGYASRYSDAPPIKEIRKIVKTQGAPALSYDLWREAIEAVEFEGRMPPRERPWLRNYLYLDQAHVGTANVAKLYDAMPGLRSGIFFTTVPKLVRRDGGMFVNGLVDDRKRHLQESGFYGPKADRVEDIRPALRFRDTGELANVTDDDLKELEFQTLERKLSRYFEHQEATAWEPDGVGQLERRHVVITGRKSVGKESNVDDDDPDVLDDPRLHKELMIDTADDNVEPIFVGVSLRLLAKKTGIDPGTLAKYRSGKTPMPQAVCKRIREAIGDMQREAAPYGPQPKPARYKNMRNLTPSGKPSTKGDTLRLHIERLRPEPARSPIGQVAMEAGIPRHVIYNWYKRGVQLSLQSEALIRETVVRLQADDVERAKVETEEVAGAERLREERRQRRRERGATRKRRERTAVSAAS
jgi:transcriptional regulator with XRE-family HTH domain